MNQNAEFYKEPIYLADSKLGNISTTCITSLLKGITDKCNWNVNI